jgi:putative nucleotidyltransferase with HDIG domain
VHSNTRSLLSLLISLLAQKDGRTAQHSSRVRRYAGRTARVLGLAKPAMAILGQAAVLHDIGKVHIPDEILNYPGKLDAASMALLRSHALRGEEILQRFPGRRMREVATLAGAHHERFDGSGYPRGLSGDAIPIGARIIAVCDAFDAMTAVRSYRHPWTRDRAIGELIARAGTQFDPDVVAAFISIPGIRIFRRSS